MTSNSKTKSAQNSGSVWFIVQLVFLGLYYLDICHNNPKEKCTTVVPSLPLWVVYLPTIIYWGAVSALLLLVCCIAVYGYIFDKPKKKDALLAEVRTDS